MSVERPVPDLECASALAELLRGARFTVDAVHELWGASAAAALERADPVPARRALAGARGAADPALSVLAELFILGDPVSGDRAASTFGALLPDLLDGGSLLRGLPDGSVRAEIDLRPYSFVDQSGVGEWWVCSDRGELGSSGPLPEDHVLGVGGASLTLTRLMVQRPVLSALDLGTGCGIQAMHASRFARHTIATDISERAVAFARFNAALNAITTIEFRVGDLFDPVEGERFDLIVSNPPFVITPRVASMPEYVYRDGGLTGDRLVATVVTECARHLGAGGIAQFLGNWESHPNGSGTDRVRGWIDDARAHTPDLQALVVERTVQDPAEYAATWVRDGGTRPDTPAHADLMNVWLDDFEHRGVARVGLGFVVLRRDPAARTFTRVDVAHDAGTVGQSWGANIITTLDAQSWLTTADESDVLDLRAVVAADVTEERSYWPGAADPSVIELRRGSGWQTVRRVGSAEAALVGACDGELSIGAIVQAIAEILEQDPVGLRDELLPRVRELISAGFLTVPGL